MSYYHHVNLIWRASAIILISKLIPPKGQTGTIFYEFNDILFKEYPMVMFSSQSIASYRRIKVGEFYKIKTLIVMQQSKNRRKDIR